MKKICDERDVVLVAVRWDATKACMIAFCYINKKNLHRQDPRLRADGVICVGGRIWIADLPATQRHFRGQVTLHARPSITATGELIMPDEV